MRGWLLVIVGACYSPSPPTGAPCNATAPCPSEQFCSPEGRCVTMGGEIDASTEPPPDACVDPLAVCDGDELVACDERVVCTFGCASNHCRVLAPSNGLSQSMLVGVTAELTLDKLDFDTENGGIRRMNEVIRPDGEGVVNGIGFAIVDGMGVFTAKQFVLPPGETWSTNGGNPPVFFSATSITFEGQIDVGGVGQAGGPGSAPGGSGNGGSSGNNPPCRGLAGAASATAGFGAGGGGGGAATQGGAGGPSNGPAPGAGGTACNVPSTIPLRGGNGGGAGGIDPNGALRGGRGGGGGGAVALVAMESITISGTIAAPGEGGFFTVSPGDGGGGGGSGGAIFVEAPSVTLTGRLTANGGGGAGPTNDGSASGSRGSLTTGDPALGGLANGIRGGNGGAGITAPTTGANATDNLTFSRGGGGGGAVGRIEIRSIDLTVDAAAITSPPHVASTATLQ